MKFPYELSEQRQSLLSKEDLQQYLLEHSEYYSYTERKKAIEKYQKAILEKQGYYIEQINEDEDYNDLSEAEKQEMAKELSIYESSIYLDDIADIFEEYIGGAFTKEEYDEIKESILKILNEPIQEEELNEDILAPGHDLTHWLPNMGWLGKLSLGLLSGALAGIIGLIMAGKDKAAMMLLKKYMNKLVEKVDNGVYKERSLFDKIFKAKGNVEVFGDHSKACLRQIQEDFSKQVASDGMVLAKNLGFLPAKCQDAMNDVENNKFDNGGMAIFIKNIGRPIASISSEIK